MYEASYFHRADSSQFFDRYSQYVKERMNKTKKKIKHTQRQTHTKRIMN